MKKVVIYVVALGLTLLPYFSLVKEAKAYIMLPTPQQAIARYSAFILDSAGGKGSRVTIDGRGLLGENPTEYPGLQQILNEVIFDVGEHSLVAVRNNWDWQWTTMMNYSNQQLKAALEAEGNAEWYDEIMSLAAESFKADVTTEGPNGESIVDMVAEFFGVDPSQINVDRIAQVGATADIDALNALITESPMDYAVLAWSADVMKVRWAFAKDKHLKVVQNMVNAAVKVKPFLTDFLKAANHNPDYELDFSTVVDKLGKYYNPFTNQEEEIAIKSIPDLDLLNSFLQGDQFYNLFIPESTVRSSPEGHPELDWTENDFIENTGAYNTALFNLELFIKTCEIAYPEAVEKRNNGKDIDVYNKVELADKLTKDVDKIVRGIWADLDFNPDEYGWEVTEELVNDWIIPAVEEYYSQLAQVPDVIGTTAYYPPTGQDGGSVGTVSGFGGFQGNNSPFGGDVNSNPFGGELW